MSIYRVHYKAQFLEHNEFGHRDVEAKSTRGALQRFLAEVRDLVSDNDQLEDGDLTDLRRTRLRGDYSWWDGDWLYSYRAVEHQGEMPCPTCAGVGVI